LAAYNQWGLSAFQRFNGMWAIILYDEKEKKIICSRDRFGIKPLYYTRIANRLYFASEIKAFQAIKAWQPKINHTRLMEYLAYNMSDHTEETMFANVYQIPKSHHGVICLQTNDMCINRYYDIHKGEQNDGSKFMELFYDAIKLRTRADVPLATTLSGGMDSSSIVSVMANKMEYKPITYTLAYPGYKLDDPFNRITHIAKLVTKRHKSLYWTVNNSSVYSCLKENSYDLIICNETESLPIAHRLAEKKDLPIYCDLHEFYLDDRLTGNFSKAQLLYEKWIFTNHLSHIKHFTTVSPQIIKLYKERYNITCTLLDNACKFYDLSPKPTSNKNIRIISHGAAIPARKLEVI
ncbi:asparagine synthase-related protein, partial [Saprospiraceae bacterium]|nr:asparagine synthase-related protein [Saprospiraceae bacterium]